jgi:hypothetical protein
MSALRHVQKNGLAAFHCVISLDLQSVAGGCAADHPQPYFL